MVSYTTIAVNVHGALATVTLNRPEVRNAMNLEMIRELTGVFRELGANPSVRIVVLDSGGPHFSAGADLNWMREGLEQPADQLLEESRELARLFLTVDRCPRVVVAAVKGRVMGGANGLVAAADIVVAEETARFAFSEVKLGLIPATIAPYVYRKAGQARTSELMLTGRVFDAMEARQSGLVHRICREGELAGAVQEITGLLLENGPVAMQGVKELIGTLRQETPEEDLVELTAGLIARHRVSDEGQEGIRAFFEKRKPNWHEEQ